MDATEVTRRITREMVQLLGADLGGAWFADGSLPPAGYHLPRHLVDRFREIPASVWHSLVAEGDGPAGAVYATESQADPRFRHPGLALLDHKSVLALPMRLDGATVGGVVVVWVREPHTFTTYELRLAQALADRGAIAVENARLYEEAERGRRELETVAVLARNINASLEPTVVLQRIVEAARDLCGSDSSRIAVWDPETQAMALRYSVGARTADLDGFSITVGHGAGGQVLLTGRPFRTDDYLRDPRISKEYVRLVEREGMVALMVVPVRSETRVEGLLYVGNRSRRAFSDRDEAVLLRLADQAAIAIENARLFREANAARQEIEILAEIGRELTQSLDLEQVLGLILDRALYLAEADVAYIALTQEDGVARSVACRGAWTSALGNILVRPGSGAAGLALRTGEIQESAGEVGELWEPVACEDVRAALVVPLKLASRSVGLLWLGRRSGIPFSERAKTRLQALSLSLATALDNARLYKEIALKKSELEAANTSLAETLQIQAEFLANTSHELRTPLVSILGLLGAISSGLCTSRDEEQAFVTQAHTCAEELLALINNILDMAKISAGRLELDLRPVEVAEVFEQVRSLVQGQLASKPGLRLAFHPPAPGLGVVPADPDRLKQVLVNLVGNSLKFTDEGEVTVRAVARPEAGFMTIQVVDTGIGIPQERQARLFQKFVQADGSTSRKHGGTGLGLAISKHLIEMMGGVIALESRGLGHGTTVTLSLPLSAPAGPAHRDEPGPEAWAIQGPNETPLVLVVEDNVECRSLVRDVLHAEGFQTVEAATADEGFEMAVRLHPALVIADLALSCSESAALRNGVDLVTALARKPGLEKVPAILLTGAPAEGRALLRNVDTTAAVHLLEKPLGITDLRAAVDRALQAGGGTTKRAVSRPGSHAPALEASLSRDER